MKPERGLLEVHLAVLLQGLAGLFARFVEAPALVLVVGRTVFAAAIIFLIAVITKNSLRTHNRRDQLLLAVSGALLALHWLSFFISIKVSSVAIGLLTYASFPLFVTFLEPIFFAERLRLPDVVFAVAVALGLALVVPRFDLGDRTTVGVLWGILSGFTFAVLSLFNRGFVRRYQPMTVVFHQTLFAALVLLPFTYRLEAVPSGRDILLLVVLGVVCTALAHGMFIRALRVIKASLAGVVAAMEPVYGISLAVVLLGEVPTSRTLMGGSIILATTVLATRFRQR